MWVRCLMTIYGQPLFMYLRGLWTHMALMEAARPDVKDFLYYIKGCGVEVSLEKVPKLTLLLTT